MSEAWEDTDRETLERRAAALSKPLEDDSDAEETVTLLTFTLMGSSYAVFLSTVEAVTRIGDIFAIPLTPKHIAGVIRRRGQTIALISLRHFFHPETEALVDSDFAVISIVQNKLFALQVEEIEGVQSVAVSDLAPPPENFDRTQAPYLYGVTGDGLAVLDLEAMLAAEGFGMDKKAV